MTTFWSRFEMDQLFERLFHAMLPGVPKVTNVNLHNTKDVTPDDFQEFKERVKREKKVKGKSEPVLKPPKNDSSRVSSLWKSNWNVHKTKRELRFRISPLDGAIQLNFQHNPVAVNWISNILTRIVLSLESITLLSQLVFIVFIVYYIAKKNDFAADAGRVVFSKNFITVFHSCALCNICA